jgi:DNA repair protein RecO (recombination protein O)
VLRWHEVQLLGYLGYAPELTRCVECHNELTPVVNAFSPALGGVVCVQCKRIGVGRELSVNALKVLRLMQRNPYSNVGRVRLGPALNAELESLMQAYITHILEADLRSTQFIRTAASPASG